MSNSETNEAFLLSLDGRTVTEILNNIANHYGITKEEALEEVCDKDAHSIMDYITGDIRPAVSLLFNKMA